MPTGYFWSEQGIHECSTKQLTDSEKMRVAIEALEKLGGAVGIATECIYEGIGADPDVWECCCRKCIARNALSLIQPPEAQD